MAERYYATISWEGYAMRAEKRIRRDMDRVLRLCYEGADLVRVSRIPGAPGLRTLRRWVSLNLYGFGRQYHLLMRGRAVERIRGGLKADLGKIRARIERQAEAREQQARELLRRVRTKDRTR
jgi:hypothetical protein